MKPIIVLGMHRSGTSAITRAIGLLGAAMGEETRLRQHWENVRLRKINQRLLTMGRGSWDAPPEPEWLESQQVRKVLVDARKAVAEEFGGTEVMVWKDPRTCLTVPFWLEVFDDAPAFLLIHRHPTEVADSLSSRDGLGRGHGYAVWERYNADALRAVRGRPTVVVEYDSLVASPVESLAQVTTALASFGIELPNDPSTTEHGLVAQRRHHLTADSIDAEIATPSQRHLHHLLRELTGTHAELTLTRTLPSAHPLSVELLALARRNRLEKRRSRKQGAAQAGGERSTHRRAKARA